MRDSDPELEAIADRWAKEYAAETGHAVYSIHDGGYAYFYDIEGERVVGAFGRSGHPRGPRDGSRQQGAPAVPDGDHKGHVIAHSMGGGLDINLFKQNGHLNLSREWRSIERTAARNPGTPVAVRLRYDDDSDRPSTIEYAYEHPERGPVTAEFNNRTGSLIREQPGGAPREARSGGHRSRDGRDRAQPPKRSEER